MATIDVLNPATEAIIASIEDAGADAVDVAVTHATLAFPAWAALAPGDRARLLRRFADVVAAHEDDLAALECDNVGKPMAGAGKPPRWPMFSTTTPAPSASSTAPPSRWPAGST
jgi:acyl-CoA reductase-like NAD-dependent aldehyde dehydrogenase